MGWEKEITYAQTIANHPAEEFVEIGGQSIHCEDLGSGPALVMLHGFSSSSYSFRFIREPLSQSFRVLAIDLNGFGLTQRPHKKCAYHFESQADLIVELLSKKGIRECYLMGHSYGAVIGGSLAERYPELVSKMILVCPPSEFAGKTPWYVRGKLGIHFAIFLFRLLLSNSAKFHQLSKRAVHREETLPAEVSDLYRRSMLVEGFKQACLGYVENFALHRSHMIRYREVTCPVLIIAGEQDTVVSQENIDAVQEMISDSRSITIPECGHCPPEEQPQRVIDATLEFLGS